MTANRSLKMPNYYYFMWTIDVHYVTMTRFTPCMCAFVLTVSPGINMINWAFTAQLLTIWSWSAFKLHCFAIIHILSHECIFVAILLLPFPLFLSVIFTPFVWTYSVHWQEENEYFLHPNENKDVCGTTTDKRIILSMKFRKKKKWVNPKVVRQNLR